MKILKKIFGSRNTPEPVKAIPVATEIKPPKPVITLDIVDQTQDEAELLKLASEGATSPLRQAAAQKISSRDLLEQLAKTAKNKDKNVYKIVKSKLDTFKAQDSKQLELETAAERICEKMEKHTHQEADTVFKAKLNVLQEEWKAIDGVVSTKLQTRYQSAVAACEAKIAERAQLIAQEEEKQSLDQQALQLANEALSNLKEIAGALYATSHLDDIVNANYELKIQELTNAVRLAANRHLPMGELTKEFEQRKQQTLNLLDQIKTSGTLTQLTQSIEQAEIPALAQSAQTKLQQLIKFAREFGEDLPEPVVTAKSKLDGWFAQRAQTEQAINQSIRDFSDLLRKGFWAAEQGFIRKARGIHKELVEKHSQLANLPKAIQTRFDEFEEQLRKLGDWHEFAVTPKKEALVEQMQGLINSKMAPEDLATKIHDLQDSWKEVSKGGQQQDDDLWQQFQQASAQAYAPCKEFFEAQAAARDANLTKRRDLVNQLQTYMNAYDWDNAVWKDVEQTLKVARQEWQTCWPVPRKAGNDIQKEFENLMEQLFGKIAAENEKNKQAKQNLIQQTQALTTMDDIRHAVEQAKKFQAQWKTIGKSWHKEDQQLWQEFRQQCDAIFARRNQEIESARSLRQSNQQEAENLISQLDDIAKRDLAGLNAAKNDIESIKTAFEALDLPKENIKELKARLSKSLDAIAQQHANERNRAHYQAWEDMYSTADQIRHYELAILGGTAMDDQHNKLQQQLANAQRWPIGSQGILQERLAKASTITPEDQSSNMESLKILTIRAEILAGRETPAIDKNLRMTYQVQQMQQAFGQRDNRFEPLLQEWLSLGAVASPLYEDLLTRFNACKPKQGLQ